MQQKVLSLLNDFSSSAGNCQLIKVLACVYLFDFLDRLRIQKYPTSWVHILEAELDTFSSLADFIQNSYELSSNTLDNWQIGLHGDNIEAETGKVYFNLWRLFSTAEYFHQTLSTLNERLKKNNITVSQYKNVLDAGCGAGRYAFALKYLGCRHIIGIDISQESVQLALRMNPFASNNVVFLQGSALELPFADETFDLIFSNGVLHHTLSTQKGLNEIFRVLKDPGGCFLYLYGGKDSFFWDVVDLCRSLLTGVPQAYVQSVMKVMGYPPGRIFHRVDFWYAPINRRYSRIEVENMLIEAGFSKFTRLSRGAEYDWDEILHNHPYMDPYIYGEGEMRFWINK